VTVGSAIAGSMGRATIISVWTLLAVVLVAAVPVAAMAADFAEGLAAYDAGDYEETVRVWGELAEAGDARAQLGLAGLYRSGEGVGRDLAKAAGLYRLAAEQGDDDAQLNLGRIYAEGAGVSRDPVEAYFWLSLAAGQGRRWAKERLGPLAGEITAGQLSEVERRIAEFRPR
jgi:TPR repeat protein